MLSASPKPAVTVHIVERMAPGGIETLVLDMVRSTPGDHHIVSLQGSVDALVAAWPKLATEKARLAAFGRGAGTDLRLVWKLRRFLRSVRADTVIAHHIGPLVYGGLAARLARVRRVVHVEHDAWHYDSPRRRKLGRVLFQIVRPDRVAVSSEIAHRIRSWEPGARITVIPPGIDMHTFVPRDREAARQQLGISTAGPLIGTAGRLVAVKGQTFLIEALALLNAERERHGHALAGLVIVGDGEERAALEQAAATAGASRHVRFLGHRDDLPDILPALDVFCLPSLNEGLPRSVLEAQAAGIPVVASDVGDLKSAVCPSTGLLVPAGSAAALAGALKTVLDRPRSAAPTRAFVEDRFSLATTMAAYGRLLPAKSVS